VEEFLEASPFQLAGALSFYTLLSLSPLVLVVGTAGLVLSEDVVRAQLLVEVYGAAGSLVVFLVWVYYSSLIILFGAQITHSFARLRGAAIEPVPHAVPLPR
jgi:membrane protein